MQLHARLGISVDQLRPLDHIANIRCPILVMVGEQDRNTTFRDTMLLYTGAQTKKELWIVPRVGHADLHRAAREEYERRVLAFFAQSGHN